MHPIAFHVRLFSWSRPIYWYGIMAMLGFLAAVAHWSRLARREGRDPSLAWDLGAWLMIGGLIGARLAYVAAHWPEFRLEPQTIWRLDLGGLVYYGGFAGGALAAFWFARRRALPLPFAADFIATGLPLGHALGRIGCFLNGCCYGRPSGAFPGVRFPEGSAPWLHYGHTPLHPTQLYEAAGNFLLYLFLARAYRNTPRDGRVFGFYLVLYPVGRFALEFLRGDQRLRWAGLTAAQVISTGLFGAGAILLARIWTRRGRERQERAP